MDKVELRVISDGEEKRRQIKLQRGEGSVQKIMLDQAGIINFPLLKPGFTQRSEQSDAKDYVRTQCMRLLDALSINKFITEVPGHQEKPRELASL